MADRSRSPQRRDDKRPRSRSREREREREKEREPRHHRQQRSRSPTRRSASPPPRRRTSRSPDHRRRRSRSRSRSRSSSASSDTRRRHRRKGKEKEKDKDADRHRSHHRKKRRDSRSRSRSRDDSDRKRKKRHKKDKKAKDGTKAVTAQWGKHGIITEADIFTKEQEFHAYLLEEKLQNPETLSKPALKKLFLSYMEDYNTATLPHEKYYALEAYETRLSMIRAGETLPAGDEWTYDSTKDMAEHKAGTQRMGLVGKEKDPETYLSREQLQELRRVQNERTQVGKMKVLGMEVKGNFGVRMDGNQFE